MLQGFQLALLCFVLPCSTRDLTDDVFPNGEKPRFDTTGTFFWCEPRGFQAVKMVTIILLSEM